MTCHANSKRLRSLRPMATRLVSSPSPLVAFSSVAWDGFHQWWVAMFFAFFCSHDDLHFLQGKVKLLEVTYMVI